jgi:hypothetical protein
MRAGKRVNVSDFDFSSAGFLGPDESLTNVLQRDDEIVKQQLALLTHKELSDPLVLVVELVHKGFHKIKWRRDIYEIGYVFSLGAQRDNSERVGYLVHIKSHFPHNFFRNRIIFC